MPVPLPSMNEGRCELDEFEDNYLIAEFASLIPFIEAESHGNTELDSHANVCCLGHQALVFNSRDLTCEVTPYDAAIGSRQEIPFCYMTLAYDEPTAGET